MPGRIKALNFMRELVEKLLLGILVQRNETERGNVSPRIVAESNAVKQVRNYELQPESILCGCESTDTTTYLGRVLCHECMYVTIR